MRLPHLRPCWSSRKGRGYLSHPCWLKPFRKPKMSLRLRISHLYVVVRSSSFSLHNTVITLLITGRICRRQLCRYFVYSRADFGVFRPTGATRCTDQGQIWQEGGDRRSAPPCQIWPWSIQGVVVYGPQNWKKFEIYQYNCP